MLVNPAQWRAGRRWALSDKGKQGRPVPCPASGCTYLEGSSRPWPGSPPSLSPSSAVFGGLGAPRYWGSSMAGPSQGGRASALDTDGCCHLEVLYFYL